MPSQDTKTHSSPLKAGKVARRYDIDWLRVLAVLLLVLNHTACIFDTSEAFYVENAQKSPLMTALLLDAVRPWHMPLFFLLAGAASWFALSFRSPGRYAGERFRRLLIPFIIGQLVVIPPISYIGLRLHKSFTGTYLQSYPQFFTFSPDGIEGYTGGYTPGHLWFIPILFILSMVALPLLMFFRGETGRRWLGKLAAFCTRPGGLFLLVIPMLLMDRLPGVGNKNPFLYLTIFIYGYILMSDARFTEAIDRHKLPALILGGVTLAVMLGIPALGITLPAGVDAVLLAFYRSFTAFCCLVAMLGYAHTYLNFSNPFLRYASQAAYPFYILHQTVIVLIGAVVVPWPMGILPKFLIIALTSTLATIGLYEGIKRLNVLRFLFGMKPKRKARTARGAVTQPAR